MKKLLLILITVTAFTNIVKAQDSTLIKNSALTEDINRDFFIENQLNIYQTIPTNLWQWNRGDFSYMSLKGNRNEGDFKTVDNFNKDEQFFFTTESVQSFMDKGWRFYGNFSFGISSHEKAKWNLFFEKNSTGTPFRLITMRQGEWNTKHYRLKGAFTKKLNNKLSLGFSANYNGDLFFRMRDTRNNQYNLTTEFMGAINYNLNKFAHFSLGLAYFYKKSSTEFKNEFKTNGEEYNLYAVNGLGDFDNVSLSDIFYITDKNPGLYLSYFSGKKNKLSFLYSIYNGKELWKYKISSINGNRKQELYKYSYLTNKLRASYIITNPEHEFHNYVNAKLITGDGYKMNQAYRKTYIYNETNIDYNSALLRLNRKLFYKNIINVNLVSISKKDMTYAQKIEYTNLNAKLVTGICIPVSKNDKITLDIEASYRYNLDYTHSIASAATKPYTTNLAYNEVAYNTCDYYKAGGKLSFFKNLKKIKAEINVEYLYNKPTDVKLFNNYSYITKDMDKEYIKTCISLFF